MKKKVYGYTSLGKPIDDNMIEQFVEEAEKGYQEGQFEERRRGRGRPPLGDAAKVVGSLRLDPDLRQEAEVRADQEGISVSELFRKALRKYLIEFQPSQRFRQELMNEFHSYRQKLDEVDVTKRLSAIDNWFVSEIDKRLSPLLSDSSKKLVEVSEALRDLNADFKLIVETELKGMRKVSKEAVDKVQENSGIQIARMKEIVVEVEKGLHQLDEFFRSKSGRER